MVSGESVNGLESDIIFTKTYSLQVRLYIMIHNAYYEDLKDITL